MNNDKDFYFLKQQSNKQTDKQKRETLETKESQNRFLHSYQINAKETMCCHTSTKFQKSTSIDVFQIKLMLKYQRSSNIKSVLQTTTHCSFLLLSHKNDGENQISLQQTTWKHKNKNICIKCPFLLTSTHTHTLIS